MPNKASVEDDGVIIVSDKVELKLLATPIEEMAKKCDNDLSHFLSNLKSASLCRIVDIYFTLSEQALKDAVLLLLSDKNASPIAWLDAIFASGNDNNLRKVLLFGLNNASADQSQWNIVLQQSEKIDGLNRIVRKAMERDINR